MVRGRYFDLESSGSLPDLFQGQVDLGHEDVAGVRDGVGVEPPRGDQPDEPQVVCAHSAVGDLWKSPGLGSVLLQFFSVCLI